MTHLVNANFRVGLRSRTRLTHPTVTSASSRSPACSPVDGQAALFDHLYLARQPEDFSLLRVERQ